MTPMNSKVESQIPLNGKFLNFSDGSRVRFLALTMGRERKQEKQATGKGLCLGTGKNCLKYC
ncbi:MAG: hypothetical protein A2Y80_00345 [Deltaproteobacteria bacterium RBG_13_58_19]|nr:MAG: hypothetical protein A2Y80_00345 [Deltaproteobacteria bacterium RBG_13_58_19]